MQKCTSNTPGSPAVTNVASHVFVKGGSDSGETLSELELEGLEGLEELQVMSQSHGSGWRVLVQPYQR